MSPSSPLSDPSARFACAILFDLDGTLVDSAADLAAALNATIATVGRGPLSVEQVHAMIGGGVARLLARALDATGGAAGVDLDALSRRMFDTYRAGIADRTRPYPDCIATLAALRDAGAALAVVTNKREALARALLDRLDMTRLFDAILGGDTLGPDTAKPAPDMLFEAARRLERRDAIMVGDTRFDVDAAHAARMPVIVMTHGYAREPVAELGADRVCDGFAALIPALRSL